MPAIKMTAEAYIDLGVRLFGEDRWNWRFVCPCCGHVATAKNYKEAGAPEGAVGYSCVGRWSGAKRGALGEGPGPCNYAGGGLFAFGPVKIEDRCYMAFEGMDLPSADLEKAIR